jgi:hypothetical protein
MRRRSSSVGVLLVGLALAPLFNGTTLLAGSDPEQLSVQAFVRLVFGDSQAFDDTTSNTQESASAFKRYKIDTHLSKYLDQNPPKGFTEYCGDLSPNGKWLWFASARSGSSAEPDGYTHDLWRAKVLGLDSLVIDKPSKAYFDDLGVNTPLNEGFFSHNGRYCVYAGCNYGVGVGDCDLYLMDTEAAKPVRLQLYPPINTEYWESQPFLTEDYTLFFVSNRRPAGMSDMKIDNQFSQIYMTWFDPEANSWVSPIKLPSVINRDWVNSSPVVLQDGRTLIYASGDYGSLTLYATQFTINSSHQVNFKSPKRLPDLFEEGTSVTSIRFHPESFNMIVSIEKRGVSRLYCIKLPTEF